ncbi:TilS substrate-binding domain-containing protein [Streptomyces sp. NPDC058171]
MGQAAAGRATRGDPADLRGTRPAPARGSAQQFTRLRPGAAAHRGAAAAGGRPGRRRRRGPRPHRGTPARVLDAVAADAEAKVVVDGEIDAAVLALSAPPVRRRVLRSWLLAAGARGLGDTQLRAVDDLVARWRGQGQVAVGGGTPDARLVVRRRRGRLNVGLDDRRRV